MLPENKEHLTAITPFWNQGNSKHKNTNK